MKNFKIGVQLYSIRNEVQENMDNALAAVKAMGYDYVEFAGFFGKSANEVRELLEKHGLECISVHQNFAEFINDPAGVCKYLNTIGAKFCAIPWTDPGVITSKSGFETLIGNIKDNSKYLADAGIKLLYHNHDFEFNKIDGEIILDKMYSTLSTDFIDPEFDTCWVRYAGYSPAEYIKKYAGRCDVVHLKDFTCTKLCAGPNYALIDKDGNAMDTQKPVTREENNFKFLPVGQGMQDIPEILSACEASGTEYLIVEQDASVDRPAMEAIKQSREYLKTLGL